MSGLLQALTVSLLDADRLTYLNELQPGAAGTVCGAFPCSDLANLVGMEAVDLKLAADETDDLGLRHVRCHQVYQGVTVRGGDMKFHCGHNDTLDGISGVC